MTHLLDAADMVDERHNAIFGDLSLEDLANLQEHGGNEVILRLLLNGFDIDSSEFLQLARPYVKVTVDALETEAVTLTAAVAGTLLEGLLIGLFVSRCRETLARGEGSSSASHSPDLYRVAPSETTQSCTPPAGAAALSASEPEKS